MSFIPVEILDTNLGTANGKAGEGRANEESMLDVIFAAVTIADNWQKYGKSDLEKAKLLK